MDYEHIDDIVRDAQPPLCLRWETRGIWREIQMIMPCSEVEAAIIVDIVLNSLRGREWTSYSRDRSHYGADRPSILYTYRRVVPTIDAMEVKGWILHDRRRPTPRGCGWQSALSPKAELIDAMKRAIAVHGKPLPIRPVRPVLLRDAEGNLLPLPATRLVERIGSDTNAVNRFMIRIGADVCFQRIFNGTFDRGGRWYAVGGAYQVQPSEERLQILIRGEASAEVDIKALHPTMLYAERGLRLDGDAYDVSQWPRDLAKVAMLVLVNAKDVEEAVFAIARKDAMAEYTQPGTEDAVWAARRLIKEIRRRHEAIEDAFCSDAGARLMRTDSEITAKVMKRMVREGEICLPVHDSFIVRRGASELLESVVMAATAAVGLPDIKLTVKTSSEGDSRLHGPSVSGRNSRNVLTYPYIISSPPLSPSLVFQSEALVVEAPVRRAEGKALRDEPEGRSFSFASLILPAAEPIMDPAAVATADLNVLWTDPSMETSVSLSFCETPLKSPLVAPGGIPTPSPDHRISEPTDMTSNASLQFVSPFAGSTHMSRALERDRHRRAVAAAAAVAGDLVDLDFDWTHASGYALAQQTHRGSTLISALPGRSERVVSLWSADCEAEFAVRDHRTASDVVDAYLRALVGPGPRLRIDVTYAGRYDPRMSMEENTRCHLPVTDVVQRPSLVPGAPLSDEDELPFQTDLEGEPT